MPTQVERFDVSVVSAAQCLRLDEYTLETVGENDCEARTGASNARNDQGMLTGCRKPVKPG
jgi:hypothetical protein